MAPVCVLVTLTVAPTSTPPVASVTMPVIWPNVWARDAMGTARKRLVEKTSERPRRIAHLVSFLVATGGGKILMHVAALVEVGKLAHQAPRERETTRPSATSARNRTMRVQTAADLLSPGPL